MIVEPFAGAGGAAVGIHRALGTVPSDVVAVEYDPDAAATLRATGLVGRVLEADIHQVLDDLPTSDVRLLWASPPCQPDSLAGKRQGAADARDCWPVTLEAIRRCRPVAVVIENVRGSPAELWADQIAELGYTATVWELDAADYGVPQRRHRRFVVARLGGGVSMLAPPATHSIGALDVASAEEYPAQVAAGTLGLDTLSTRDLLGRRPWNTIRAALPGLVGWIRTEMTGNVSHADYRIAPTISACARHDVHTTDVGRRPRKVVGGGYNPPAGMAHLRTERDLTDDCSTTIPASGWDNAYPHVVSRLDAPSPCVSATEEKGAGARSVARFRDGQRVTHGLDRASDALLLATGRRRLTPAECAALQGFASDHPFQARTKSSLYRQVGNAVPPPLARAVARAVVP